MVSRTADWRSKHEVMEPGDYFRSSRGRNAPPLLLCPTGTACDLLDCVDWSGFDGPGDGACRWVANVNNRRHTKNIAFMPRCYTPADGQRGPSSTAIYRGAGGL